MSYITGRLYGAHLRQHGLALPPTVLMRHGDQKEERATSRTKRWRELSEYQSERAAGVISRLKTVTGCRPRRRATVLREHEHHAAHRNTATTRHFQSAHTQERMALPIESRSARENARHLAPVTRQQRTCLSSAEHSLPDCDTLFAGCNSC